MEKKLNNEETNDIEAKAEKMRDKKRLVSKIRKIFKDKGISLDIVMSNIIEKYATLYTISLDMEENIEKNGLMYLYTNKSGETNLTKNPIVAEYKSYTDQLNKLSKTILDYVVAKDPNDKGKDELSEFLGKHKKR